MVRKCEPSFCKAASEKNGKIPRKSCAQQTRIFHVAHWVPEPPALAKRHRHLLRKRVSARILHCNMRLRLSSALYNELRIPGYLPNSNTLLTRPSRKLLSEQSSDALLLASLRTAIWSYLADWISKHLGLHTKF